MDDVHTFIVHQFGNPTCWSVDGRKRPSDKSVIPFGQCQYPNILSTGWHTVCTGFSIVTPLAVINYPFIIAMSVLDRIRWQMRQSQPLLPSSNGVDKLLG